MARKPSSTKGVSSPTPLATSSQIDLTEASQGLMGQLIRELAPVTAYEMVLARNLAANELQADQLRHRRERLLRHRAGDMIALQLTRCTDSGAPGARLFSDDQIVALVRAWISGSLEAAQEIARNGIDEDRCLTDAFLERCAILKMLDDELAHIEGRRRRLLKDYRELKKMHSEDDQIADAEVVE